MKGKDQGTEDKGQSIKGKIQDRVQEYRVQRSEDEGQGTESKCQDTERRRDCVTVDILDYRRPMDAIQCMSLHSSRASQSVSPQCCGTRACARSPPLCWAEAPGLLCS